MVVRACLLWLVLMTVRPVMRLIGDDATIAEEMYGLRRIYMRRVFVVQR